MIVLEMGDGDNFWPSRKLSKDFTYFHYVGVSVSHRLYLDSIAEATFSNDFQLSVPVHYYDLRIISLFYNFLFFSK